MSSSERRQQISKFMKFEGFFILWREHRRQYDLEFFQNKHDKKNNIIIRTNVFSNDLTDKIKLFAELLM
jgi:hypothetical protein